MSKICSVASKSLCIVQWEKQKYMHMHIHTYTHMHTHMYTHIIHIYTWNAYNTKEVDTCLMEV